MSKVIDLTGQVFDYWTVLSRAQNNKRGEAMWLCKCKCGNERIVHGYSLRNGLSKSCGCLQKKIISQNNFEDLTNQVFGHLKVLEFAGKDASNKILWKCQCDCSAKTIKTARTNDLKCGKVISCGCVHSRGEEKIAFLLSEANIPFEREKTFSNCRFPDTNGLARFDFYVNNQYIIEYDGIQHFQPTFNKLNQDAYKITLSHDQYKDYWCKINNIPIIHIPYTKLNNLTLKDLIL